MRQLPFLFVLAVLLISCGGAQEEQQEQPSTIADTIRYAKLAYKFPPLSKNTLDILENWSVFSDFQFEATSLDNLTKEELQNKTKKLLLHTDSLAKNIPDTLVTNAIRSRLIIVDTRVRLLNQEAGRDKTDSSKIENYIAESNNAIKNFLVQIDEKFEKDGIDFKRIDNENKELEKQKRYLDSIYQLELNDQNEKEL